MNGEGKIEYPCSVCRKNFCECDRSVARARLNLDNIKSWTCKDCPMEIFFSLTDFYTHRELKHPTQEKFIPEVTNSVNGTTVKEVNKV